MSTVIGVTGAFGSGCTLAAKTSRDERRFQYVALSDVIRAEWASKNAQLAAVPPRALRLPSLRALPTGSQADILHVPKSLLT